MSTLYASLKEFPWVFPHLAVALCHMAIATWLLHKCDTQGIPKGEALGDVQEIFNWPTLA